MCEIEKKKLWFANTIYLCSLEENVCCNEPQAKILFYTIIIRIFEPI
jgi:hypothetical protein